VDAKEKLTKSVTNFCLHNTQARSKRNIYKWLANVCLLNVTCKKNKCGSNEREKKNSVIDIKLLSSYNSTIMTKGRPNNLMEYIMLCLDSTNEVEQW